MLHNFLEDLECGCATWPQQVVVLADVESFQRLVDVEAPTHLDLVPVAEPKPVLRVVPHVRRNIF